jgi:nucleoside-diphosphate kinase
MNMSNLDIETFYHEHKGKSFFPNLVGYMKSGPVVALCLEAPGAIKKWRNVMGKTNTFEARKSDPWSMRALFGKDGTMNATHGSDSLASSRKELHFWFNIARVDVGREPAHHNATPQQASAIAYLKEWVDPIFAPLLQRILSARPDDVNDFVVKDLSLR